ncbi:MAG: hypothetical protein JST86_12185 [Bacteroidetes bacterium]|nr:hypothetical protein [Bacteroidota bacterium]
MRLINHILPAIALVLVACCSCTHGHSNGFIKDIPTYIGGRYDNFYLLAKGRQKQLGLDSIENGFQDLQIRVWYTIAFSKAQKLVLIINKDSSWTVTVYDMQVNWNGETEKLLSKTVRQVTPHSGWATFSKTLADLKIISLPNQDDVEGYSGGEDGKTYSVEVATKNLYRFYSYWEPQQNQNQFWQAKNMTAMLTLFDDELGH